MSKKLTKAELIEGVAAKLPGTTKKATGIMLNALFDFIAEQVAAGNTVPVPGIGTLSVSERREHTAKNPKSGEKVIVPACTVPVFKFVPGFRESVKNASK